MSAMLQPVLHIHPLRLVAGFVVVAYVAAVATGFVGFAVWSQILDHPKQALWEIRWTRDAHALRYALMLPTLTAAEWLRMDVHRVFSYEVAALILLTARLLNRARTLATGDERRWSMERAGITIFFVLLSLSMNGRLSFALCGMALLLCAQVSRLKGRLSNLRFCLWIAVAQLFTAVSSGTFSVALAALLVWAFFLVVSRLPAVRLRDLLATMAVLAGGVALVPVVRLYMAKNVGFYGGGWDGFVNMLNHGPGVYLYQSGPLVGALLAFGSLGAVAFALIVLLRKPIYAPAVLTIFCALSIGLFGYSTLMMGLPSVVFLVSCALTSAHFVHSRGRGFTLPAATLRSPEAVR